MLSLLAVFYPFLFRPSSGRQFEGVPGVPGVSESSNLLEFTDIAIAIFPLFVTARHISTTTTTTAITVIFTVGFRPGGGASPREAG